MKTIVGLFDTYAHAQNVVKDLVDAGVPRSEISLLANDREGKYSQSGGSGESTGVDDQRTADGTTVGENVAGGALLGGIGGLLIGLGALAIPGIGPVIAAGPLATTLAGAGFGALGGGLIGAIKDMGVPDEDAHVYAEGVRRGGTLVSVHVDEDMTDSVTDILNRHDAIDVDERSGEYKTAGWSNFSHEATPYSGYDEDTQRRSGSVAGTATSVAGSPYAPGTTSGALDTGTTNAAAMGTGGYGATGSSLGVGSRSEETRARRRARVYPRS